MKCSRSEFLLNEGRLPSDHAEPQEKTFRAIGAPNIPAPESSGLNARYVEQNSHVTPIIPLSPVMPQRAAHKYENPQAEYSSEGFFIADVGPLTLRSATGFWGKCPA
jgi:hypothetical protein